MKEIKPTYVTFEQAKWLKEKGFNEQLPSIFLDGELEILRSPISNNEFTTSRSYSASEQWQVVEWLRVNHGIWVSCYPTSNPLKCQFRIYKNNNGVMSQVYDDYMGKEFNSPQEAYSAAFDYVLNNSLI
jgi:hypothetical protein